MVLFRSIHSHDVKNDDDLRLWTMRFFANARSAPTKLDAVSSVATIPAAVAGREAAQLCAWLSAKGYRYSTECGLGGAVAIVEDVHEDGRMCVCLDGGSRSTVQEWRSERRAQTAYVHSPTLTSLGVI